MYEKGERFDTGKPVVIPRTVILATKWLTEHPEDARKTVSGLLDGDWPHML